MMKGNQNAGKSKKASLIDEFYRNVRKTVERKGTMEVTLKDGGDISPADFKDWLGMQGFGYSCKANWFRVTDCDQVQFRRNAA